MGSRIMPIIWKRRPTRAGIIWSAAAMPPLSSRSLRYIPESGGMAAALQMWRAARQSRWSPPYPPAPSDRPPRSSLRQQGHLDAARGHVNAPRVRLPGPLNDLRVIRPFDRQGCVLRPGLSELLLDEIGRHSAHHRIVVAQKAAQKRLAARIVDLRQSADSREARIVLFVAPRSLFRRGQRLQLLRVLRLRIAVDGVAADDRVRILE